MIIEFGTGHTGYGYVKFLATKEEEDALMVSLHHGFYHGRIELKAVDEHAIAVTWEGRTKDMVNVEPGVPIVKGDRLLGVGTIVLPLPGQDKVQVCSTGTILVKVKGHPDPINGKDNVYLWLSPNRNGHIQNGFEAEDPGENGTFIRNARYVSKADANGVCELRLWQETEDNGPS